MRIGSLKDGQKFKVVSKKDVYTKQQEVVSNAVSKSGVKLYFSPKTEVEVIDEPSDLS